MGGSIGKAMAPMIPIGPRPSAILARPERRRCTSGGFRGYHHPVPRRGGLRHRLPVPGHRRRPAGAGRLRHVPGLARRDRAQPDAVRLRRRRARRAAPDPRPPRSLRADAGPRAGRLPRTDPRHPRHGGPRRDRAARLGQAAGRVRRALEPTPRTGRPRPSVRPRRSRRPWRRKWTTRPCPSGSAPRRRRAGPRRASRCTTRTTSTARWSRCAAATTTTEVADHRWGDRGLPRRGPHPRLGDHRAALRRRRGAADDRLLRRPRPRRHADPARPDTADPRRCRHGRVDLRQPRARAARRGDRGAGRRHRRGGLRRRRSARPGLRDRSHPGADLGARRPRAGRPHPRIPLYLDSPMASQGDGGVRRAPGDLRRGDARARCAPATRR